eukprot:10369747-Alexandrium_andersonii.AAC.1
MGPEGAVALRARAGEAAGELVVQRVERPGHAARRGPPAAAAKKSRECLAVGGAVPKRVAGHDHAGGLQRVRRREGRAEGLPETGHEIHGHG